MSKGEEGRKGEEGERERERERREEERGREGGKEGERERKEGGKEIGKEGGREGRRERCRERRREEGRIASLITVAFSYRHQKKHSQTVCAAKNLHVLCYMHLSKDTNAGQTDSYSHKPSDIPSKHVHVTQT